MTDDPENVVERLASCREPFLIGVRHHSPACAAAVPALLDRARPERLLVELPAELQPWLEWLGHPELEAPVALAAVRADGEGLCFYPFADFSPELAAVRWAVARGVPVEAFDLPVVGGRASTGEGLRAEGAVPLMPALLQATGAEETESLWDRLVEAHAPGSDPEAVRRAALLFGWAIRLDQAARDGVSARDLRRESHMRSAIGSEPPTTAVVVGAFHAAALLPEPLLWEEPEGKAEPSPGEVVTSLIAYSHELLDSRSGYPAGIRDPLWQHRAWEAMTRGEPLDGVVAELVGRVCVGLRAASHVAGVPDAREAVRVALDLALLRGLPGPGRRELLEGVETALGRGELLGRGRALARSLERALVGARRGRLPKGTPRSGLGPHVEALLEELDLPGPGVESVEPKRLRLDPLRSRLDCRRHVALERLRGCGVPYGEPLESQAIGATDTLTELWSVRWTPATEAMLALGGVRGVTLEQAATGALRAEEARLRAAEGWTARARLDALRAAAACALEGLSRERLEALAGEFLAEAGLAELVAALEVSSRVERGHVPGLALEGFDFERLRATLLAAALAAIEGLAGSERLEDAVALVEVSRLAEEGAGRLGWAVDELERAGSPLMQGAAGAVRVLLGRETGAAFGARAGSWVDGGPRELAARLTGALVVAAPLFEADPGWAAGLLERVEAQTDEAFLARLPALREGFDVLSPAARGRLLEALSDRLDDDLGRDLTLEDDPSDLAMWARADRAGLADLGTLDAEASAPLAEGAQADPSSHSALSTHPSALSPRDRWRLILGRERDRLSPLGARCGRALDDLYGSGRGEGSRGLDPGGAGGGREAPFPSAREWAEELEELFGSAVREEVLGRAAERGRAAALVELDPESVTPSVELLEQVLALKGGLPEAHLGRLRRIVRRVVDELVRELATRVRPALTGLTTPRSTRRPGGPLDLRRTVAENLKTVRGDEGARSIVPERLYFKTRARRSIDWRVVLVVDTSGSMEASVIYSAMMAAILAGIPAVSVNFVAFNTEVVDLSDRVDDPLGLLLEVSVGGGTHIARGLRYARELMTVPSRTLVIVVTDFEEGWPVEGLLAEVRALAGSGAKPLGLAALDDRGAPRYNRAVAEQVAAAGMPVAALTPLELARWVGERIR